MTAHGPRLNRRVLTAFLLVGLPVLVVGGGLVLGIGQSRLSASFGRHLEQVAQQTAADLDTYVFRRILDVTLLARTPEVRRLASEASREQFDRARTETLDREWQAQHKVPPVLSGVLSNGVAKYFADIVASDRIYRELLLTDRNGRAVAASNTPTDYYQADEDWWIATFDDGRRGRASVSDVRWDESARAYAIEIAVPVHAAGNDELVGILKVVTESREMLASVAATQFGATGESVLIRENGSVVYGRQVADPNARFFAAERLAEPLKALRAGGRMGGASFAAKAPDGSTWLVGIAESQLGRSYPNISWIVAVSQARDELLAPVHALGWYLLTLLGLLTALVLGLALWFSMRLAAPQVDIDIDLMKHAHVGRVGEVEEPSDDTERDLRAH